MNPHLQDLLKQIALPPTAETDDAIRMLALVLEKNRYIYYDDNNQKFYETYLTPELFRLHLEDDEENVIVERVAGFIASGHDRRGSLFWTLGKAKVDVATGALLALIRDIGGELTEDESLQAMFALGNMVMPMDNGEMEPSVARQLTQYNIKPFLQKHLHSEDSRFVRIATRLLRWM